MRKHRSYDRWMMLLLAVLLLLVSGFFSLLAYGTYRMQLANTFTVGFSEIAIQEEFDPPEKLAPGVIIKKRVAVKNTGTVPCRIRVIAQYTNEHMKARSAIDINTADWTERPPYYYYNKILAPGEYTADLFTTIKISDKVGQAELEPFDILIYGEAIQGDWQW